MPTQVKGEYILVGFLSFWGLLAVFLSLLGTDRGMWSFLAFLGTLGGAVLFLLGFRALRRKRLIENTPTSKCRSVAMGFVEVAGKAAGESTFPSLVGQIPCYCSEIVIERYERRYNSNTKKYESEWVTVQSRSERMDFYVDDGTGKVRVNPVEAQLKLACDLEYDSHKGLVSTLTRPPSEQEARTRAVEQLFQKYCAEQNIRAGHLRFSEGNLCPGSKVYVLGTASEVPGARNEQERVVITKGKYHPWFFIAESSQKQVLGNIAGDMWLYLLGGTGVFLFCLRQLVLQLEQS